MKPRALLGARHQRITPYTPRHNGKVERCSRILAGGLSSGLSGARNRGRRRRRREYEELAHAPHGVLGQVGPALDVPPGLADLCVPQDLHDRGHVDAQLVEDRAGAVTAPVVQVRTRCRVPARVPRRPPMPLPAGPCGREGRERRRAGSGGLDMCSPCSGMVARVVTMGERQTRSKKCWQCNRPLDKPRWRRPKRFCRRWHQVRYWLETVGEFVFS